MSKTSTFTTITPLPSIVSRELVLSTYHDHIAMIELNPLVVERFKCKPPSYSSAEEFHATWYTIKDKISYLPGGIANGSVSYHACFHDLPDALQTHVYAPLGLDIRAKWSVGGSLPGEPKEAAELGLGIPKDGLYIREDVKMKCNIMMISFVKKTFKEAHSKLIDRLVEKTHLLEVQNANDKLRSQSTNRTSIAPGHTSPPLGSPMFHPGSPGYQHLSMYSNASSSDTSSPMASPKPLLYQPPTLNPYGQFPNPNQEASPYRTDPRYSQYGQQPQRHMTYDEKPLPDPRYSHYSGPNTDPRYELPHGQHGGQRMSMHPADQKVYEAYQPQNAPVELPTSDWGKGGQNEPAELA